MLKDTLIQNTQKLLLFVCLFITTAVVQAQDAAADNQASTAMPIDLVADKGTYDQLAGLAVYEGNVKVTQGVSTIWADKLVVVLKDNAAERIEATGKPVKFQYLGDKQPIYGQAKEALYQVIDKTITLTGEAEVKQGEDIVKGTRLTYHLDAEIIQGQRVKMTFQPK